MAVWSFHIHNFRHAQCKIESIIIPLCALFAIHFALSIIITYYLYISGFITFFGISLIFILLVHVMGLFHIAWIVIWQMDERNVHPLTNCFLIAYLMAALKREPPTNICKMNSEFLFCKVINYCIVLLTLPIFIIFAPIYSISNLLADNESEYWIKYQILSVALSTLIQIILFCLSTNSFPLVLNIFVIVSMIIGITYLIIALFLAFDTDSIFNETYWYFTPFMIVIECLLQLNMVFIASHIGLTDFTKIETILLLITLINAIALNSPFYKSYAVHKYVDVLRGNIFFQYVAGGNDSQQQMNRMLCILDSVQQHQEIIKIIAIILNQLNQKAKSMIIEKKSMFKRGACKIFFQNSYILLSLLAFLSPFGWMVWISLASEYSIQFIFLWMMCIAYLVWLLSLGMAMKKSSIKISINLMQYAYVLEVNYPTRHAFDRDYQKPRQQIERAKQLKQQMPMIEIVFQRFQAVIAMLILLYAHSG